MWSWQVIADLEEEKRRHAEDTAEGDDVTCILEKERERLQQQVTQTTTPPEPAAGSYWPTQTNTLSAELNDILAQMAAS